jgi:DNA-directed RNA polymerase subunit L|tara:strand:- start:2055 stop:2348 length:294 start_codon:yes stop_codon:yes gene_type:complete
VKATMELKLIEETKTSIKIQIEKVDFSIPDIIHQEILNDNNVVFAGVLPPHPILKQFIIKMEVKPKIQPIKTLTASGEKAWKQSESILKEAQQIKKE